MVLCVAMTFTFNNIYIAEINSRTEDIKEPRVLGCLVREIEKRTHGVIGTIICVCS